MGKQPTATCSVCGRSAPKREVPDQQIGWRPGEQADRPVYSYKWELPVGWVKVDKDTVCVHEECVTVLQDYSDRLRQWESARKNAVVEALKPLQAEAQRLQTLITEARAKVQTTKKATRASWEKSNPKPTLGSKLKVDITFQEAVAWATRENGRLRATDPRFDNEVILHHQDGSTLSLQGAFVHETLRYVLVFSEHHNPKVYPSDEVVYTQKEASGGHRGRPFQHREEP